MAEQPQSQDYEKNVALIVPRWCVDMLLDHLDMQYDSLCQERDWYQKVGDEKQETNPAGCIVDELKLYSDAIDQIAGQLNNS